MSALARSNATGDVRENLSSLLLLCLKHTFIIMWALWQWTHCGLCVGIYFSCTKASWCAVYIWLFDCRQLSCHRLTRIKWMRKLLKLFRSIYDYVTTEWHDGKRARKRELEKERKRDSRNPQKWIHISASTSQRHSTGKTTKRTLWCIIIITTETSIIQPKTSRRSYNEERTTRRNEWTNKKKKTQSNAHAHNVVENEVLEAIEMWRKNLLPEKKRARNDENYLSVNQSSGSRP